MLIGLLLAAQIVVSVILVGVVLLQRSEGGGFVGGGSPSGMMSVRGKERATCIGLPHFLHCGSAYFVAGTKALSG